MRSPARVSSAGWKKPRPVSTVCARVFRQDWRAGDKTGTGGNGSHNDCCITWPPGRAPIVIASYLSESSAPNVDKAAAHAEIARIIVEEFT
jgi:beta-lactamase class A